MENTVETFNIQLPKSAGTAVKQSASEESNDEKIGELSINRNNIAGALGIMAFLLILANCVALLADHLTDYSSVLIHKAVKLFYVELELNAPAFFSTILLLFASSLLMAITLFKKKQASSFVLEWSVLSLGFLFMAFDEIAAIHERLIEPMRMIFGEQDLGIFYFTWVVPAIAFVGCLGVFFLRFLAHLPARTRWAFLIAAAMYLGGAVGLEMVEGWYSEINGRETLFYMALTTLEESLEMAGTVVFIWTLLGYIGEIYEKLEISFNKGSEALKSE